ncbi:MAG: SpoIID/LytB domain-containing protein, partial [Clostridia bacterium]|nr:SpoIID/LytB domain-containing protein [Clostridia bacterium]
GTRCVLRQYPSSAEPKENALRIKNNNLNNYYPGNMVVTVADGGLRFVNYVYMEDYLYGVLPFEIGEGAPFEAQKAQALCARTYAAYKMLSTSQADSDLVDTEADQVYRGLPESIPKTRSAVDETAGQLLTYEDKPIYAAYSSSNGGWTETNYAMWGGQNLAYTPYKQDPYDVRADTKGTYRTRLTFPKNGAPESKLNDYCKKRVSLPSGWSGSSWSITGTSNIRLHSPLTARMVNPERGFAKADVTFNIRRSDGATATATATLELRTSGGLRETFSGYNNYRMLLLENNNTEFVLVMCRPGHAIGVSQSGAMQMAREGMSYSEILHFYFHGITIKPGQYIRPPQMHGSAWTSEAVNLRDLPNSNAAKVIPNTIPKASLVEVIKVEGDWAQIRYVGWTGWCMTQHLTISPALPWTPPLWSGQPPVATDNPATPEPTLPPTLPPQAFVVAAGGLYLRAEPDYGSEAVVVMPGGVIVDVLENGDWFKLRYENELIGYAESRHLQMLDEATEPPPAKTEAPYDDSLFAEPPPAGATETQPGHVRTTAVYALEPTGVRLNPSIDSRVIATVAEGAELTVISPNTAEGWAKIKVGDITGFVRAESIGAIEP